MASNQKLDKFDLKKYLIKNKAFFASFGALFSVYFTWWLAFFPGVMTSDSLDQWAQSASFKFNNLSPYIYAFIMSILRVFSNTPGPMGFLQLLLFSLTIALFINYAYKKGVNKVLLVVIVVFFCIWPQFGIYSVTIWKDVMYSIFTLALGLSVFIYFTDKEKRNPWLLLFVAFSSAMVALFRFNGIVFLIIPAIIFLIFRITNWKKTLILLLSTLGLYFFVANVLFGILNVEKNPAMADGFMVKTIGAIYHLNNPKLSEFEKKSFEALQPESDWKRLYNCTSQNEIVLNVMKIKGTGSTSPAIDPNPVNEENFHRAFYSALAKNPWGYVRDRLCLSNTLFSVTTINGLPYMDTIIKSPWNPVVKEDSKIPKIKGVLLDYLHWTADINNWSFFARIKFDVFWSAWPMAILLAVSLVVAVLKRLWGLLIYNLFILFNLATIVALTPAMDYRYIYFLYVCMPFVFIIYILEKQSNDKNYKNKNLKKN